MRHFSCRLLAFLVLLTPLLFSCNSPSDSGTPNPPPGTPSVPAGSVLLAPTNVIATNTTSQDTISWSAASGAKSYNLYYRPTTSGVTKANGAKIVGATSPFTQTGLTNGTTYYYVVTAVNATGESPESSEVSATPLAAPSGAVITGYMEGTERYPQSNFNWNGVTGATSYNVYHSPSAAVTPLTGTKVGNDGSFAWRLGDGPAPRSDYFIVTAVNSKGESAPSSPAVTGGPGPLNPNRYLPNSAITPAGASNSDFRLNVKNPFNDNTPIVFLGSKAPEKMALATAYYATGFNSTSLGCYNLADSTHNGLTMDTDVGDCTIYGLDWTFIRLGTATQVDGIFTLTGHGLKNGDTVYIGASAENANLKSGAYLVVYVRDPDSFCLDCANIALGDSINYLAKVNPTVSPVLY